MTETAKKKKRVRINYKRAAVSLSLLVLIVSIILSAIPGMLRIGDSYNRDLLRASGGDASKAPKLTAQAAVLYSIELDKPVYEKNPDKKLPPYSTTKLLTCYLALENLDPDLTVTISEKATEVLVDGMEMELEPGEKLKAIDLIYASMMMSANDAATALGEAVSGSIEEFADLMNETVKDWGCENTHFVNANGWEDEDHYTTAGDMAVIAKHCLENETLREIALTKKYTVPATNKNDALEMENAFLKTMKNNKLLIGGKTGSWSETECAIVLGFRDNGLTEVISVLGDTYTGRQKDPVKLMNKSHDLTPGFIVTKKGDVVCNAWVRHGAVNRVGLKAARLGYAYPKSGEAKDIKVKTEIERLKAPVSKGDKAGKYYVYANDELVYSGDLYAAEDVKTGWLLSYFYMPNSTSLVLLLMIALIIALGFVLSKKNPSGRISYKRKH